MHIKICFIEALYQPFSFVNSKALMQFQKNKFYMHDDEIALIAF